MYIYICIYIHVCVYNVFIYIMYIYTYNVYIYNVYIYITGLDYVASQWFMAMVNPLKSETELALSSLSSLLAAP